MANRLHQILDFVNVVAGGQATLPHDLNIGGTPVVPDRVLQSEDNVDFDVVAVTATAMTVQNNGAAPASASFWLERLHTIERVYGSDLTTALVPQPFVAGGGSSGGGGPAIDVQDEGVAIPNNPHATLNFVGEGVTAADAGAGVASVTIPGTVNVDGVTILGDGSSGSPLQTGTLPSQVDVQDEGVAIPNNPHSTLNFVGAGVIAADAGAGVASVAIPGTVTTDGFTITGNGQGTAITSAWAVQNGGAAVAGAPHKTLNFTGSGKTVTNSGGGVAAVAIPVQPTALGVWQQNNVPQAQAAVALTVGAGPVTKMRGIRDGSFVGLSANLSTPITQGSMTLTITRSGGGIAPAFAFTLTPADHPSGNIMTRAPGAANSQYFQGEELGITITTSADLLPANISVQAFMEVVESIA